MNFVVLEPTFLPSGCRIAEGTVRTETPTTRASYRFIVRGKGRQFRVKQFFYDWMHPTLADTNLDLPGRAFLAQGIIGFLGPDYKGNYAACWSRWFTQVEL